MDRNRMLEEHTFRKGNTMHVREETPDLENHQWLVQKVHFIRECSIKAVARLARNTGRSDQARVLINCDTISSYMHAICAIAER